MNSREEIENIIRQHRQVSSECKEIITKIDNQERDFWRQRAGSVVDVMAENQEEAQRCLYHADAKIRSAALAVLMNKWNAVVDQKFIEICEEMSMTDADPETRALALTHLGSCYQNSENRRIGRLLSRTVLSTSLPDQVRAAAYFSLFALCGKRDSNLEFFLDFQFPDNVDWKFVELYR